MPPIDRHSVTTPHSRRKTVLVLTDGSAWATRVAEWGLVFADAASATVHHIDVIDCLDAGVIVHRYTSDQETCEYRTTGRHPTDTDRADTDPSRRRFREPTIDVLHGVPHEAIRDYASTHAIDLIIICVRERARSERTFLGDTLARVTRRTTIPTMTVEQPAESHEPQRQDEQSDHPDALDVDVRTDTIGCFRGTTQR
jgi:nucleotide-binding universal stress UspA family protein